MLKCQFFVGRFLILLGSNSKLYRYFCSDSCQRLLEVKGFQSNHFFFFQNLQKLQIIVMGRGQIFLTRVGSGQPSLVWVWKIHPRNPKNFKFLSFRSKYLIGLCQKVPGSKPGRPLIYSPSKVCLGQNPYLITNEPKKEF